MNLCLFYIILNTENKYSQEVNEAFTSVTMVEENKLWSYTQPSTQGSVSRSVMLQSPRSATKDLTRRN